MRDLLVQTDCRSDVNLPKTRVAPKNAKLGDFNQAALQNRLIKNIPDNVTDVAVCKLFASTTDITWLGQEGRLEFEFSELGEGKIIRNAAAALGRKGGSVKSERKTKAVRENAKLGGRPKKEKNELT